MTMEDIPLLINVVFSTTSKERVRIFELLIEHKGRLTTSIITASLNSSNNAAKRTMAEFHALGLVDLGDTQSKHGEPEKEMTLKDEFQWFLSDEFNTVRKNTPYYSDDDDKHTQEANNDNDNYKEDERLGEVFPYSINTEIEDFNNPEISQEDIELVSQRENIKLNPKIVNNIFKTYPDNNESDVWSCRNCREKWSKYDMMVHNCKGSL